MVTVGRCRLSIIITHMILVLLPSWIIHSFIHRHSHVSITLSPVLSVSRPLARLTEPTLPLPGVPM